MPDRVIRDEILDSDRWLDLPSDTDRLAFLLLVLKVDDFGNTDGNLRTIYRFLTTRTQVKTEENTAIVLTHLADADMVRPYEVAGRPFLHIPRFRPHRQYLVRKWPPSPWDGERKLGKNQRVEVRGLAKSQALGENIATTSLLRGSDVAQGVGVGVGVLSSLNLKRSQEPGRATALPPAPKKVKTTNGTLLPDGWSLPDDWLQWAMTSAEWSEERVLRESLVFRDHWQSTTKNAHKRDWFKTWCNWIRRAAG